MLSLKRAITSVGGLLVVGATAGALAIGGVQAIGTSASRSNMPNHDAHGDAVRAAVVACRAQTQGSRGDCVADVASGGRQDAHSASTDRDAHGDAVSAFARSKSHR